jgi:hypothetical protein
MGGVNPPEIYFKEYEKNEKNIIDFYAFSILMLPFEHAIH